MNPEVPRLADYRDAIRQGDLSRAARQWQAACQSPHSEEFRREFDFSQVQEYSLAWQTGDLGVLEAVGARAVAHPQSPFARFLNKIADNQADAAVFTHPEIVDTDPVASPPPKSMTDRAKRFVDGLLAQGGKTPSSMRAFITHFNQDHPKPSVPDSPTKGGCDPVTASSTPTVPVAYHDTHRPTVRHLLDFLAQDSIRNRVVIHEHDLARLSQHPQLELPSFRARKDLDLWAKSAQLDLPESSLKQLYRAALLFSNRLTSQDASSLSMAARTARPPKKRSSSPPESPSP